jgi:drug/metabolite transporter (DMT)-like permease
MNYYKNTRGKGVAQDNKGFFAIEQLTAALGMIFIAWVFFKYSPMASAAATQYREAFSVPTIHWPWELAAGLPWGIVAFFSVFLFMFKGRTATFAGLVNRLTSLIAGTVATLLFAYFFGGKFPALADWVSLLFILIAVAFLTKAEKKRGAKKRAEEAATTQI